MRIELRFYTTILADHVPARCVFYRQLLKGPRRAPWCPTLVVVRHVVDLEVCAFVESEKTARKSSYRIAPSTNVGIFSLCSSVGAAEAVASNGHRREVFLGARGERLPVRGGGLVVSVGSSYTPVACVRPYITGLWHSMAITTIVSINRTLVPHSSLNDLNHANHCGKCAVVNVCNSITYKRK